MKNKKGISLIVLIITIIVVIILAATVIFTITKNNPVNSAKEAAFKQDVRNFQEELNMYISNEYTTLHGMRDSKINTTNIPATFDEMKNYIASYNEKYDKKLGIEDDKIVYFPKEVTEKEKKWLEDLGIKPYGNDIKEADEGIFKWDENDDTKIIGYNEKEFNEYLSTNKGVLKIPERCKIIGDNSFSNCDNIKSVIVPDSVTSIEGSVFQRCYNLESIKLPDTLSDRIHTWTFYMCTNLKSITIPNGIEVIDKEAFYGCSSLTNVIMPNTLKSIYFQAFSSCVSLTEINLSDSVTSLGWGSFSNCENLEKVNLGKNLTTIGYKTFINCEKLQNIQIPSSVTSISQDAFENTKWYNSKEGLIYINDILYRYKDDNLSDTIIEIKEGTKSVSTCAFTSCKKIVNVTIPYGIERISEKMFLWCDNLKNVSIPDSVKKIDEYAFQGCKSMTEITLPNSVTRIENGIFYDCSKLTSITFKGTKEEWNGISKSNNWNTGSSVQKVICTDGEIEI